MNRCSKSVFSAAVLAGVASAAEPLAPIRSVEIGPHREFRVNGDPFLPIMSWLQRPNTYADLRKMGFTAFAGRGSRNADARAHAEAARAAGGYAITDFDDQAADAIGHPYLLAWIHGDEPDMPQRQGQQATPDAIERGAPAERFQPRLPPADVEAHYRRIVAADRLRPVCVTFTGHFFSRTRTHYSAERQAALYPAYVRGADVIGFDIYPIYGSGRPGWLNYPAEATRELVALGGGKKPVYAWIETSKGSRWMTYEKQPDVLPIHTRFQVWSVLIEGATAIGYFTHAWRPTFREFAPTEDMRAELTRLNAQLTRLAPAILGPPTARKIEMSMAGGLRGRIKATEFGGDLYIFAQNADLGLNAEALKQFEPISPRAGRATIHVAALPAGKVIEVVDENRQLTSVAGGFSDEFGPLAEHVYRIQLGR